MICFHQAIHQSGNLLNVAQQEAVVQINPLILDKIPLNTKKDGLIESKCSLKHLIISTLAVIK